jgi:hypothetical protein
MTDTQRRVKKAIDDALTGIGQLSPYNDADVARANVALDRAADAAIAAMRGPTEKMEDAGQKILDDDGSLWDAYNAMIDAALTDGA